MYNGYDKIDRKGMKARLKENKQQQKCINIFVESKLFKSVKHLFIRTSNFKCITMHLQSYTCVCMYDFYATEIGSYSEIQLHNMNTNEYCPVCKMGN